MYKYKYIHVYIFQYMYLCIYTHTVCIHTCMYLTPSSICMFHHLFNHLLFLSAAGERHASLILSTTR